MTSIKSLLRLALVAVGLLFVSTAAEAACPVTSPAIHGGSGHACYAAAAGAWSSTSTWDGCTGGSGIGCTACTCVPATGDDIVFDTNSPNGSYTSEAISLNSFDASAVTGAQAITISAASAITITGLYANWGAVANITWSGPPTFTFTNTSGTAVTITDGGTSFGSWTFNGVGGNFVPQDALFATNVSSPAVTCTSGTLDFSVHNINANIGTFVISAGCTFNGGTGTITETGASGNVINTSTSATVSASSTGVTIANASATGPRVFITGNKAWGAVNISGPASGPSYSVYIEYTTAETFASLSIACPLSVGLTGGQTLTLTTGTPTFSGVSSSTQCLFESGGITSAILAGVQAVIAVSAATNPAISWVNMYGIKFTLSGGATTVNDTNALDFGTNSNVTFTAPTYGSSGATGEIFP